MRVSLKFLYLLPFLINSTQAVPYAELRSKGYQNDYRDALSKMGQLSLYERKDHQNKIKQIQQQWRLQNQYADINHQIEIPDAKPLKGKSTRPAWFYQIQLGDQQEHLLREYPEVEQWTPNYGLTGKQRRNAAEPLLEKVIEIDQFEINETRELKRSNPEKTLEVWSPTKKDELAAKPLMVEYSPTKILELSVPYQLQRKPWWLWVKKNNQNWKRKLVSNKQTTVPYFSQSDDGSLSFKFTPELKKPGKLAPDYHYIIDTQAPVIEEFQLLKDRENRYAVSWKVIDENLNPSSLTLTFYGRKNIVLKTMVLSTVKGFIVLTPELKKFTKRILLEAKDSAGNLGKTLL